MNTLSADEWLEFFDSPDILDFCRTMVAHPLDLTPRHIFCDWLDEHAPNNLLADDLRVGLESSECRTASPTLKGVFPFPLIPDCGRFRVRWGRERPLARLCKNGMIGSLSFDTAPERKIYEKYQWVDRCRLIHSDRMSYPEVAAIPQLSQLNALIVEGPIPDEALQQLIMSPNLSQIRSLSVFGSGESPKALRPLYCLDHLAQLKELIVLQSPLSAVDVRTIVTRSTVSEWIRLHLDTSGLDDEGVAHLAQSRQLTSLQSLSLRNNQIGDDGLVALVNSTSILGLEHLDLFNNRIGDPGAIAIAKAPNLITLQQLQLSQNRIGREGYTAIHESPYLCEAIRNEYHPDFAVCCNRYVLYPPLRLATE
jgi:uncharacterized protein (TIGR02996 family)